MISKIYRYKILPSMLYQFLEVQRLADKIYSRHLNYQLKHFQEQNNPGQWVELHFFRNEADAKVAENLSEKEPELKILFSRFLECLDPADKSIDERLYDDRSISR